MAINGTSGNDTLNGTTGGDTVNAGAGNDSVLASSGDDLVYAQAGNDTLLGESGVDTLSGGSGADSALGGIGNDHIVGGQGSDTLLGEADNDSIVGDGQWLNLSTMASPGTGALTTVTLTNSAGGPVDLYYINSSGSSVFVTTIAAGRSHSFSAHTGDNYYLSEPITHFYLENFTVASGLSLTYPTESLNDSIDGGTGNDTIYGQFGADTIHADDGNDSVEGGADNDLIYAEDGDDTAIGGTGADYVEGGAGNDLIDDGLGADQGTGNDTFDGGAGNDTLWGGLGDDCLRGGDGADNVGGEEGNDTLDGGTGNDVLYGGAGADLFLFASSWGADTVWGDSLGTDQDTISFAGADSAVTVTFTDSEDGTATAGANSVTFDNIEGVIGSAFNDTIDASADSSGLYLFGGAGADAILGGSGDDTIHFGDGDDTQTAGDLGNDLVFGDAGNDILSGDLGNDTLYGGIGNDVLEGHLGADALYGEEGDDYLVGFDVVTITDPANRTLNPTVGADDGANDLLDGGSGSDTLLGGTGSDTLIGGSGADTVMGGAGNDYVYYHVTYGDAGDLAEGGEGIDTLDFSTSIPSGGVFANLGSGEVQDYVFSGTVGQFGYTFGYKQAATGFENAIGSSSNDIFYGSAADNLIDGGAGQDYLSGAAGNDTLLGGLDGDKLSGGTGDDSLEGGAGSDTLVVDSGGGTDTFVGGEDRGDIDLLDASGLTSAVTLTFSGNEAGTVSFAGSSATFSEIEQVATGFGADVINASGTTVGVVANAGAGNDTLIGGAGDDVLSGGAGSDLFQFSDGFGADTIIGGEDTGDSDRIDLGTSTGLDIVFTGAEAGTITDTGTGAVSSFSEIEEVSSGAGNDTLDARASSLGQMLDGNAGADLIYGGTGADTIYGDTGTDTIFGGEGNDSISTGTGADTLIMGNGFGHDLITDFDMTPNGALTTDQMDVSALRDGENRPVKVWDVAVSDDGFGNAVLSFPGGESLTLSGIAPAAVSAPGQLHAMGIPCIVAGMRVATPRGPVPVEALRRGDLVNTFNGPPLPVLWAGMRRVSGAEMRADPRLVPVEIKAWRLGNAQPVRLSALHAVFMPEGAGGALARAGHLAASGWGGARAKLGLARHDKGVSYHHLLLPRHALISVEGLWVESFWPGKQGIARLSLTQRQEVIRALPRLAEAIFAGAPVQKAYAPPLGPVLRRCQIDRAACAKWSHIARNGAHSDGFATEAATGGGAVKKAGIQG